MRTAVSRPGIAAPVAALAGLTLAAWLALPHLDMMTSRPLAFVFAWTVMMTAMMVPSSMPFVLVYGPRGRTPLLAGYLLVWALTGIAVYALAMSVDLMDVPAVGVAAVLAVAGVYQFTPLKDVCLRACRSPLDFIAVRWGRNPLRLGAEHGLYCLGCCWALMAVLVLAAAMSLTAALLIAAVVFAEKVLPAGRWTARLTGLVLLGSAIVVLVF